MWSSRIVRVSKIDLTLSPDCQPSQPQQKRYENEDDPFPGQHLLQIANATCFADRQNRVCVTSTHCGYSEMLQLVQLYHIRYICQMCAVHNQIVKC